MRKLLLISMMIVMGFNLYSGGESFAEEKVIVVRSEVETADRENRPVLKRYDQDHLGRIALPLGGIGTGTVSLGGRGDLRDWEIMNRPAKGFVPLRGRSGPFFALYVKTADGQKTTRAIEGPIELSDYEDSHGSTVPNHGLTHNLLKLFGAQYAIAA